MQLSEKFIRPMNIRQIGEKEERCRIYIEDYAQTFLSHYKVESAEDIRVLFLYGRNYEADKAVVIEGVCEHANLKRNTTEGKLYEERMYSVPMQFEKEEPLGVVFVIGCGKRPQPEELKELYGKYDLMLFQGGEEDCFFLIGGERVDGYSIYYEQNEGMQEYLIQYNEENRKFREGVHDVVSTSVQELGKKEEPGGENGTVVIVFGLLICLCITGIMRMNDYRRLCALEEKAVQTLALLRGGEEQTEVEFLPEQDIPIYGQDFTTDGGADGEPEGEVLFEEMITKAAENPSQEPQLTAAPEPVCRDYIVQAGDTLTQISLLFYGDREHVTQICEINGLANPDELEVGQKILLP